MQTTALLPVKNFAQAKSRLRPVLGADERAALARCMTRDVLAALGAATRVDQIRVVGSGPELEILARTAGAGWTEDAAPGDLNRSLEAAAGRATSAGADRVLIVPGDLPGLEAGDVDALLAQHHSGVIVCPAACDGGTNALIVAPPDAIRLSFGERSAGKHVAAARAAGLSCALRPDTAFERDIDTPGDLAWLCALPARGRTGAYLIESGIAARIGGTARAQALA